MKTNHNPLGTPVNEVPQGRQQYTTMPPVSVTGAQRPAFIDSVAFRKHGRGFMAALAAALAVLMMALGVVVSLDRTDRGIDELQNHADVTVVQLDDVD